MAYQFGIGNLYAGPVGDEMEFGCLQGITVDFSFDRAQLYCGDALYPSDVRIHTSSITAKAQFAEINAESFYYLVGGNGYTAGDTSITINEDTKPDAFRTRLLTTTDGISMIVTFQQCRTDALSFAFERTNYVIPDFGFTCFSDANGVVATIDLGDAS